MKIIDIFLIAALIITITLVGAFLNQILPQQNLTVLSHLTDQTSRNMERREITAKPAAHSVSIKDVPEAQVVVGLFCLVFGTITFLPLMVKNDQEE